MTRAHKNEIWQALEELQTEGEITLKLLPPHGLTLISKTGNRLKIYLDGSLHSEYDEVSEAFYDSLCETFDSEALKYADL